MKLPNGMTTLGRQTLKIRHNNGNGFREYHYYDFRDYNYQRLFLFSFSSFYVYFVSIKRINITKQS